MDKISIPVRSEMTLIDRSRWLLIAKRRLADQFESKYMSGQEEHGGDLGEIPTDMLIDHLEQELLDAYAYLAEIRRRMNLPQPDPRLV